MRITRRQWWQGAVALGAAAAWGTLPASPFVRAAPSPVSFVEAPGSPLPLPASASDLVLGDVNGDGTLDIVLPGNPVVVYLGNGDGTFGPAVTSAVGAEGQAVTGDFNRDGKLDLVVSQGTALTVLLGNGDGTFRLGPGSPLTSPTGVAISLNVADLNGDGIPDIVGAGTAPQNGVPVLLGNGDGTFRDAPPLPIVDVYDGYPVTVHDFNSDGIPDVVYAGYQANTSPKRFGIRVLLGNGDGTFRVGSFTPTPLPYPEHVVGMGVFRRGDVFDVVLAGGTVLRSNGDGTFTQIVATNTTSVGGAAADYNGDGLTDFAFSANPSANHIYVVTSNGDGTFTDAFEFPESDVNRVQAGEVNGDGRPDLVAMDPVIKEVHVYLNTGPYPASRVAPLSAPHAAGGVAVTTPAITPPRHAPLPTPTPLPHPPTRMTTGEAGGTGTGTTPAATPLSAPPRH